MRFKVKSNKIRRKEPIVFCIELSLINILNFIKSIVIKKNKKLINRIKQKSIEKK